MSALILPKNVFTPFGCIIKQNKISNNRFIICDKHRSQYNKYMNKSELIKTCLISDDAIETYPFKDDKYGEIPILRHKSNGKWFALIFYLDKKLCINLKCDPHHSAILRDLYPFITPAWHMNKVHWIKVEVDKTPVDMLKELIEESFELTK